MEADIVMRPCRVKRQRRECGILAIKSVSMTLSKLAVLTPAPRAHLTRYHGILAPAAAWRTLIIPRADENPTEIHSSPAPLIESSTTPNVETEPAASKPKSVRLAWSELMKRVFQVDVL